jgi:hypothetical protein
MTTIPVVTTTPVTPTGVEAKTASNGLAFTGASTGVLLVAAGMLLGVGVGVLAFRRTR